MQNKLLKESHTTSTFTKLNQASLRGGWLHGYAENLDEMLERLNYDILYIENMSLFIDLKIMIHTILIILEGRGK